MSSRRRKRTLKSTFLRSLKYFRKFERPRVKLGAIAKDEAAYIPMWALHHFRSGFDEIEIYANLIEDNTYEICEKISSKYPLKIINADSIYEDMEERSFQREAYKRIFKAAKDKKFNYLMFLDIDEFFVSSASEKSVTKFIKRFNHPDIGCFQWANRCADRLEFGLPFDERNFLQNNPHVKTLFRTDLAIQDIDIHNVISHNADYILADGIRKWNEADAKVIDCQFSFERIKEYFILHRMYRSKVEYISILGRGQSSDYSEFNKDEFLIKKNRFGYDLIDTPHAPGNFVNFRVPSNEVLEFQEAYSAFIRECQLEKPLKEAQEFILDRARRVLAYLPELRDQDPALAERLLRGIDVEAMTERLKV